MSAPPNRRSGASFLSSSSTSGIILGGDGQTFAVKMAHGDAEEGHYPITITINHDGILSHATNQANISDPSVILAAGPMFSATEGETSSVQTVATFTDPGGPESDPDAYVATVSWGDGTTSTATLRNGAIALDSDLQTFSINLAHQYDGEGAYTITTTVNHEGVSSARLRQPPQSQELTI